MPTASATSYIPDATYIHATWNAVEELAQAFSVLITGMPPMPISRRTTWPRIISWPVISPAVALPTTAASSFDLSMPGRVERALDGLAGDVLHAAVEELSEVGHAGADDGYVSHGRPPACLIDTASVYGKHVRLTDSAEALSPPTPRPRYRRGSRS